MNRKRILWLLFLLFPLSLTAQETTLSKLYQWLDASKGIQMQVSYSMGDYHNQPASYYGYGKMFYLESELLKAWYDGTDLWVYLAQSGEVNLSTPDFADLAEINPLLNLKSINTKDYKITKRKTGALTTLNAVPYNPSDIEWVEVTLASDTRPLHLLLKERGVEQVVKVEVKSLKQGAYKEMQQKDFYRFTKNKLPGVAVIDLR